MDNSGNWYAIDNIDTIDSPTLIVYPDRVRENLRLLKTFVPDTSRLRPHIKTNKMIEVAALMLEAGIYQFKCATIAEAEMLAMVGATDVLLAYQPVGPKVNRLLHLVQAYPQTQFACLTDNSASAKAISLVFEASQQPIRVFLDLNVGMNRTGIVPNDMALALYEYCHTLPGLQMVGLHAYDGHFRDTDLATRQQKCDAAFEQVIGLKNKIVATGFPTPSIVAGGTPTFPIHAQRSDVVCSPGTFVFWDWGYDNILPEQRFAFAALVVTRVVSVLDSQTLCLDLGHKSIASENPIDRRVYFLNAPDAQPIGQSEEHLVVKVADTSVFPVGTVLYGVPYHVCPTVALHDRAWVVENQTIATSWQVISRNRYINN